MMETVVDRNWKQELARSAAHRREQEALARVSDERRKERRDADRVEDEFLEFAVSAMLASAESIERFRLTLDRYDTATVEALIENQKALYASRDRLEEMLGKAYVLPDGRRVFKTEDGLRVFDEHGTELNAEDVDPDLIEDWRPKYEKFFAEKEIEGELVRERTELLEFQKHLDMARERLDQGELTEADLEEMEADLEESMPIAVRRNLSGFKEAAIPAAARDFSAAAGLTPDLADLRLDMPEFGR